MEKYIIIMNDTFEEVEALTQVDFLRRADITVDMVSITGKLEITSNRGIKVLAEKLIEDIDYNEYSGIIIPGGLPSAFGIRDDERVIEIIKKFDEEKKLIAGICAAPCAIAKAGVLKGRKATIYPGMEKDLLDADFDDSPICVDENIITAKGAGLSLELAYTLVRIIKGKIQEKQLRLISADRYLQEMIIKRNKEN